jgi:hypothetical protein
MATKKPTTRRKPTKSAKKGTGKKESEMSVEKQYSQRTDNPIKGAAALGIVAVLIGLTIGGYIASRYFDPPTQEIGVPEDLIEQLATQLADDMVSEREAIDLDARKGYVQEIVEVVMETEGAEGEVETELPGESVAVSLMRYINGYYSIAFSFPASWIFDGEVEAIENQTRLGVLSSDKVELVVNAVEFSELSFKRAARKSLTTEDQVIDDIEDVVRRYSELNTDSEPLELTLADVDYGNEEFKVDSHDAFVDWYTEPVLEGEPRATVRQYWVNGGSGTMYHLRFTYPVIEPTEELLDDLYLSMIDGIIASFEFTNDGIGDDPAEVVDDVVIAE